MDSVLGHQFTVPSTGKRLGPVSDNDLDKLAEGLGVVREEPEQLIVEPVSREPAEEAPTEGERIENAINDMKEFLVAAEEMQKVLGEKLKNRTVTVDPAINPAVRDAIRRLFGVDSNTVTYDMYKQALKWRSELSKKGRQIRMAPASSLQPVDMSLTQKVDIQQSYWLLFDKMKDDFVGKQDLELALKASFANGGVQSNSAGPIVVAGAQVTVPYSDGLANAKAVVYAKLAQTGAAVREKGIEAAETATTGV